MPVATYTDYEQGRRSFTLEKAWEFADALGCSLDELAGRSWEDPDKKEALDPRPLLKAWNDIGQFIQDFGYENLDDASYADDDESDNDLTDEEADALSDGYSSNRGRSMLDAVNEISSGEQ